MLSSEVGDGAMGRESGDIEEPSQIELDFLE